MIIPNWPTWHAVTCPLHLGVLHLKGFLARLRTFLGPPGFPSLLQTWRQTFFSNTTYVRCIRNLGSEAQMSMIHMLNLQTLLLICLTRSTLPYLGNILDKLSFSKLPTKKVVLQRFMFEIEHNHGAASVESAALTTQKELFDIWEYAGYRDILKDVSQVLRQIRALHESYKALIKTPVTRRHKDSFKKKLALFTSSLDGLFDIALEHLKSSNLITKEDRDFLKNHWRKTVSSTADHKTRDAVLKKLARREKSAAPSTPTPASTPTPTSTSGNLKPCLNIETRESTSQRSASPLLSAILPWRQKPATSLLRRLEDCHLPQSRLESLPSPPSPKEVWLQDKGGPEEFCLNFV